MAYMWTCYAAFRTHYDCLNTVGGLYNKNNKGDM